MFDVPEHAPLVYLPKSHDEHVLHWRPFVVPLQDPLRYFPLAQFWLLHVLQVKPLVVPEQVPALYWLLAQFWLEHAEQAVLKVPKQPPVLYWPDAHAVQVEHAAFEVPEQPPLLYFPGTQPEQGLQENPLVVPEQLPTRYELAAQFWLLHAWQAKPLLVPEHDPLRYWLLPQLRLPHVVQAPLLVADEPFRNCPALHTGWAVHTLKRPHAPLRYCPAAHWERHSAVWNEAGQLSFTHRAALHIMVSKEGGYLLFTSMAQL